MPLCSYSFLGLKDKLDFTEFSFKDLAVCNWLIRISHWSYMYLLNVMWKAFSLPGGVGERRGGIN